MKYTEDMSISERNEQRYREASALAAARYRAVVIEDRLANTLRREAALKAAPAIAAGLGKLSVCEMVERRHKRFPHLPFNDVPEDYKGIGSNGRRERDGSKK